MQVACNPWRDRDDRSRIVSSIGGAVDEKEIAKSKGRENSEDPTGQEEGQEGKKREAPAVGRTTQAPEVRAKTLDCKLQQRKTPIHAPFS